MGAREGGAALATFISQGMNILPVRRMRVPEEIVDQIRGFIASGELRPGDQLPSERELAERFQVSRASIREALTALLTRIVQLIGDAIREQRELFQTPAGARASLAEYHQILDAIRRRDGEAAYHGPRQHVDTVRQLLEAALAKA